MSDMDIRNWVRENRPDLKVGQRGRLSPDVKAVYDEAHRDEVQPVSSGNKDWEIHSDGTAIFKEMTEPVLEGAPREDTGETPPKPPAKKKLFRFGDAEKPRTQHKRVSTATVLSWMWGGMGTVIRNPNLAPVARTLQLQAPVAGEIADDMVKGTVVDKVLQPLARVSEKGEDLFALVGPPAIAMAICMQPELYPMLEPMMVEAIKSWVAIAGPRIRKAQQKEAKLIAEMGEDYGESIREMLQFIFAPVQTQESPDGTGAYASA